MFAKTITKRAIQALVLVGAASTAPLVSRDRDDFNEKMLEVTNWYRAQHGANPVSWDDGLADYATNYAKTCPMGHSDTPYGESVVVGDKWTSSGCWANVFGHERIYFDFDNGGPASNTGHFTQLVWKDTTRMGCGWAQCSDGFHVVCEYLNVGNVSGDNNRYYRENVGRQVSGNANDEYLG